MQSYHSGQITYLPIDKGDQIGFRNEWNMGGCCQESLVQQCNASCLGHVKLTQQIGSPTAQGFSEPYVEKTFPSFHFLSTSGFAFVVRAVVEFLSFSSLQLAGPFTER